MQAPPGPVVARLCRDRSRDPEVGTDPGWTASQVSTTRWPRCFGHIWLVAKAAGVLTQSPYTDEAAGRRCPAPTPAPPTAITCSAWQAPPPATSGPSATTTPTPARNSPWPCTAPDPPSPGQPPASAVNSIKPLPKNTDTNCHHSLGTTAHGMPPRTDCPFQERGSRPREQTESPPNKAGWRAFIRRPMRCRWSTHRCGRVHAPRQIRPVTGRGNRPLPCTRRCYSMVDACRRARGVGR